MKYIKEHLELFAYVARFAEAENWFKPPMIFIDRTKAVIQHFLEKSFK